MSAVADKQFGDVRMAVIGGSGLYQLDGFEVVGEVYPHTPWGFPSDRITICKTPQGTKVAFLPRHGRGHVYTPSEVPSRANIAALKRIGVQAILAFSAVGSLREDLRPGDFVLPDQIVDRTKGIRPSTFFESGIVGHVGFADPFHAPLAQLVAAHADKLEDNSVLHTTKTLCCMEGPAFSTRAESRLYRSWGCDVINMSALPEAKLAREAEIAYQMVCMVTDYDCWRDHGDEVVTVEAVMHTMRSNRDNAKNLLSAALPSLAQALNAANNGTAAKQDDVLLGVRGCARQIVMTSPERLPADAAQRLEYILPGYFSSEKAN
ncbi:S-methyl-5-thioadenosine phosphorylase [Sorochytrium milnesiophthora]